MKKKIWVVLRSVIFILIGVFLFWLVYRKQDFKEIFGVLKQAKWEFLLLSIILGLISHYFRAARWKLLIKPLGYNPRTNVLFYTVMIMYLTNLAIPRSGEIVRCATANKYEKVPFTALLGTVVTERIIDFVMLFLFLFAAIITQMKYILEFLKANPQINNSIHNFFHSTPTIIGIIIITAALIILVYVFRRKLRKIKIINKIFDLIKSFIDGLKSVFQLKDKWLFIFYTFGIWILYWLMIYVVFFSFDFTSHLNLLAGLTIFVLASFGMVFPSPGGMGSWHFMAVESLKIYGIPAKPFGYTFAIAAHESQMLMLIVVGLLSLIAISFVKPNIKHIKLQENE